LITAALITGKNEVSLRPFDDPTPASDGVVVDIQLCGICGTDIHAYQSGEPYNPAICGHEWTGVISAIGDGVAATDGPEERRLGEGDRVVVAVPPPCGRCDACRVGQADRCQTAFLVSVGRDPLAPTHGGFAPRLAVGANRVVKVNPELSVTQAAQVEPATVAFHAVRRTQPRLGDLAVVQGAGPIGLTTMQWVAAAGAGGIVVIEPNEARRALAAELGATVTTTPDEAEAVIADHSRGIGADVVYECVGRPETIQGAVDLARRGGTVSLIGLANGSASIVPASWLVKEVNLQAALAYSHEDFDLAMRMIAAGKVDLDAMHSRTIGLDELGTTLGDLADGSGTDVKVLVDPSSP
jgi:(R,R)-butanediol dehydrogenase/meso-butanediol dehydrogenase/diacetyl reductase